MKTTQIEDFIGVFDGYFSQAFCDDLIRYFDLQRTMNKTYDQKIDNNGLKRLTNNLPLVSPTTLTFVSEDLGHIYNHFIEVFWKECYSQYIDKYSIMQDMKQHTIYSVKMQRTDPAEGYHVWHCENMDQISSKRICLFLLYLNDVNQGGETEFLYQHRRIEPKAGRLVICPAYYTHPHRGNPPLAGSKYILNGWLEYTG
jgi:hypothetical protein